MDWIFIIAGATAFTLFTLTFTKGKQALRYLFYFWILCFNFGPRTADILGVQIFYLEGVTWAVFFLMLIRLDRFFKSWHEVFPHYTKPFLIMIVVGFLVAIIYYARDFQRVLYQFKIFLTFIPAFYITHVGFKYLNVTTI